MTLAELAGKNVAILGAGREGHAAIDAIRAANIDCDLTLLDEQAADPIDNVTVRTGKDAFDDLSAFDVIIKSPGIPPRAAFEAVKNRITSGTQIFFDEVAEKGGIIIGVTGSKGKSTTSTLIAELLNAGNRKVHLIGNIGQPALRHVNSIHKNTIFVHELSSYQLMDLRHSPGIAVITAFFPEHLDYHASSTPSAGGSALEAYWEAKSHITRFQKENDIVVYNAASPECERMARLSPGRKIPVTDNDAPLALEDIQLIGKHNLSNIAAAFAVATELGVPRETAMEVLRNFRGLPHRLQSLGLHHGIEWVDDAISTTPESTIAAIDALGERVRTIILGGQDRGNDFGELAKRITESHIQSAIFFPGSGPRIRAEILAQGDGLDLQNVSTMQEAVELAKDVTPKGTICLLSTASPSYGMFKNFEEKGRQFRECIERS